jgi:hypothetical protein
MKEKESRYEQTINYGSAMPLGRSCKADCYGSAPLCYCCARSLALFLSPLRDGADEADEARGGSGSRPRAPAQRAFTAEEEDEV